MQWNAYILAGGQSSRMGQDKSKLEIGGVSLLQRALAFVSGAAEVAIVGDHPHLAEYGRVIEDVHKGCGPLGGIDAALRTTDREWNLIYAVDQLWPDPMVLDVLWRRAQRAPSECLVVAPAIAGRPEPLCAYYRKGFSELASQALAAGEYKIGALFPKAGAVLVSDDELRRDGVDASPRNVNSPQDFKEALENWEATRPK